MLAAGAHPHIVGLRAACLEPPLAVVQVRKRNVGPRSDIRPTDGSAASQPCPTAAPAIPCTGAGGRRLAARPAARAAPAALLGPVPAAGRGRGGGAGALPRAAPTHRALRPVGAQRAARGRRAHAAHRLRAGAPPQGRLPVRGRGELLPAAGPRSRAVGVKSSASRLPAKGTHASCPSPAAASHPHRRRRRWAQSAT